jgi:hypothetical protein
MPSISTMVRVWLSMLNQKDRNELWLMSRRRTVWFEATCVW